MENPQPVPPQTLPTPPQSPTVQSQKPVETPPVIKPTQKSSNKLVPLFIFLFLAALGVAGYFGWQIFQLKKEQASLTQPTPIPTPTATSALPSPTTDPTVNWEIYTNPKIGFSFKYPEGWTERPVAEHDSTIVYVDADEEFGEGPEPLRYYLWVNEVSQLPDREYTKESVGQYTAYITDEEPSRSGALTYFIAKDEQGYIAISFTPYSAEKPFPAQERYINTFDQILSTFKFLDQADSTANWKTYSNNELSFRYPSNWSIENNQIVGSNPDVIISVVPKDSTLMNECMRVEAIENKTGFVVKKFSRVTTGEMCATDDSSPREMWIMPTETDYAPGLSYRYTTKGNPDAESIFNQIHLSFKFLE